MLARLGWRQWLLICLPWVLILGFFAARHPSSAAPSAAAPVAVDHRLDGIRQAEADIQGALAVGISYLDFQHKLQALASAVVLADQSGVSVSELANHRKAIETYMDSATLWKLKIDCPDVFSSQFSYCPRLAVVWPLAAKYNIEVNRNLPIPAAADKAMSIVAFGQIYSPTAPPAVVAETKQRDYERSATRYRDAAAARLIYDLLMQTMWQQAAGVASSKVGARVE